MKSFKTGKKIMELPLDNSAKLIVYLEKDYDDYYFDALLCFFDGKKEYLLITDSFAFTIGKNLYNRIYCINDYLGGNFTKDLCNSASQEFFAKFCKDFELSECVNYDMYLYRENGKVKFLLNKIKIVSSKKKNLMNVIRKEFYKTEVCERYLSDWRKILEIEFIPRYVDELKKINNGISTDQIQNSLMALRNKNF